MKKARRIEPTRIGVPNGRITLNPNDTQSSHDTNFFSHAPLSAVVVVPPMLSLAHTTRFDAIPISNAGSVRLVANGWLFFLVAFLDTASVCVTIHEVMNVGLRSLRFQCVSIIFTLYTAGGFDESITSNYGIIWALSHVM